MNRWLINIGLIGKAFFNEDMIEYYVKYKPTPYSKPDKMFHYCNVNYALLASVVERVTGMPFEDYMLNKIFVPLGMKESYIYAMRDDTLVPTYIEKGVQGYYIGRGRPRQAQNEYLNGVKGDKIMFSDADDMYRFWIASQYGLLVPDSIQEEAYIPGSPNYSKEKTTTVSAGVYLQNTRGVSIITVGGKVIVLSFA